MNYELIKFDKNIRVLKYNFICFQDYSVSITQ